MMLPPHGYVACSKCFGVAVWGESVIEQNDWKLRHSPAAWGATDPRVLVLGFSKAETQIKAFRTKPFDEVAFSGFRPNLTKVLRRLRLLGEDESIDDRIKADEREFASGSLVRCALSLRDQHSGKYVSSGEIVKRSCRGDGPQNFVLNCARTFLSDLSGRLRLVVMLSNDDDYFDACFAAIRQLHPSARKINEMAYAVGDVLFIHVIHPAGSSGRHIPAWLSHTGGKQAGKREHALAALRVIECDQDR